MKFFSDMRIAVRLGLAFLTVVILTSVVALFSYVQLARVHGNTTDLATNWMPSIATLGRIRATANQIRRNENDHLLSQGESTVDEIEKLIAQNKSDMYAKVAEFEKLISSEDEKQLFLQFKQKADAYFATQTRLLAISRVDFEFLKARDLLRGYPESNSMR